MTEIYKKIYKKQKHVTYIPILTGKADQWEKIYTGFAGIYVFVYIKNGHNSETLFKWTE